MHALQIKELGGPFQKKKRKKELGGQYLCVDYAIFSQLFIENKICYCKQTEGFINCYTKLITTESLTHWHLENSK
jgi:hypothetical protein